MNVPDRRPAPASALRTGLAFVAAIIAPAIVTVGYFVLLMVLPGSGTFASWLVLIAVATIAVSAFHVLLLFAPAYLLLRRTGRLTLGTITAAGFACAALPTMLLSVVYGDHGAPLVLPLSACIGAGTYGAIGGLAFWWVWRANAAPGRLAASS